MTTIQEINSAIINGMFSNEQLNSIVMAVKFARNQIVQRNKSALRVGDDVKFVSTRNGQVVLGQIQKINRKFIIVRESNRLSTWRVPANMLEAV